MKYLRTVSTTRLLATLAGVLVAIGAGAAIAVAAASGGPVPPPQSLAGAVHDALGATAVQGISARIKFTNHLIDASDIQGGDPILTGASGRLWLAGDTHRLRLELQSDNGDAQVVLNGSSFWIYDPTAKTVYEGTLPAGRDSGAKPGGQEVLPSVAQIQQRLGQLLGAANVTGPTPTDVAGQPAYRVRVSPKHDGGLLGAAAIAWDSNHGVPLDFSVFAAGERSPVLELKATDISFGPIAGSVFQSAPPSGAKVVKLGSTAAGAATAAAAHAAGQPAPREITGVAAVAARVPFRLAAAGSLVGLPRRSVQLLDWQGSPAALVAYGQNLGGIAVVEQPATAGASATAGGDPQRGLTLPTVSINGDTGQELDTALGTLIRFTHAGVAYTVVGSVPPAAAERAARELGKSTG